MAHEAFERPWFVMDGEPIDDGLAGFVHADQVHFGAFATELENDHVERLDTGDVPDMGVRDVDGDLFERFFEVEGVCEILG